MLVSSFVISLTGFLIAGAAPYSSSESQTAALVCQTVEPQLVNTKSESRSHTLDNEPPGRATFTVLQTENGCSRPVHVNGEPQRER